MTHARTAKTWVPSVWRRSAASELWEKMGSKMGKMVVPIKLVISRRWSNLISHLRLHGSRSGLGGQIHRAQQRVSWPLFRPALDTSGTS